MAFEVRLAKARYLINAKGAAAVPELPALAENLPGGQTGGEKRTADQMPDPVVKKIVGMAVRADGKATAAVRPGHTPIAVTGVGIDGPLHHSIDLPPVAVRNRPGRAAINAFLAYAAEFDGGRIGTALINRERSVCRHRRDPHPGAKAGRHQQSHPPDLAQARVAGHQGTDHLVVSVDMGPGIEAAHPEESGRLESHDGAGEVLPRGFKDDRSAGRGPNETMIHLDG